MKEFYFSIVIPTYNDSSGFIGSTIETCLSQYYENYEIIVYQDKIFPSVEKKINSYSSSRLKFYGGSKRLSITENWELALDKCKGEYVLFLGHDDGLLFNALRDLNIVVNITKEKLIRYERINFDMVDSSITEPHIDIPLIRGNYKKSGIRLIYDIINFKKSYTALPMLYNSIVHRDLLKKLKNLTGRVFASRNPDVYTGFALAYLSKNFFDIGKPMAINTGTVHSMGISILAKEENDKTKDEVNKEREYISLFEEQGIDHHPEIPDFNTVYNHVLEAFMTAKDNIFPFKSKFKFNKKNFYKK